jgi:glycerol uptake facilitator-like aquaporin
VSRDLLRALTAEAIGTFALVFGDLHALWLYILAPIAGTSLGGLAYPFVRGEQTRPAGVPEAAKAAA